jgi:predicted ATPase
LELFRGKSKKKSTFPFAFLRSSNLPTKAPWIFITGENGDGKTSFLQAMAIVLAGS